MARLSAFDGGGNAPELDGGFERVVGRAGRAVAFSLSFWAIVRVYRVTRRVCG